MNTISLAFAGLVLSTSIVLQFTPPARRAHVLWFASVLFYLCACPGGIAWLLVSTVATYLVARRLPRMKGDTARISCIVGTIGALLGAMALVHVDPSVWRGAGFATGTLAIGVPLGISYYSFRLVGYLLDVAWGRSEPATKVSSFLAYVAFFPQITSGPIQRWGEFNGEIGKYRPGYAALSAGMRLVLWGLFKKLVVANRLGFLVSSVFSDPTRYAAWTAVAAVYAFPVQLYADFSGLTDMARGVSVLLGISTPENFNQPFAAKSVQEFWGRWHMTLTRWLRDYLFTPLHLALRGWGRSGVILAVSVNMLAVGLWHGFRWTFAAFGVLNALYVSVGALRRSGPRRSRPGRFRSLRAGFDMLLTFHLMAFAFVFFRADTLRGAASVLGAVCGVGGGMTAASARTAAEAVACVSTLLAVELGGKWEKWRWWWVEARYSPAVRWAFYYAAVLAIIFAGEWGNRTFIYARF